MFGVFSQDDAINLTRVVDQVFTKLKERKESFSRSLFKIIPLHKTCFSSSSEVENMINAYLNDESVKRDFENKTVSELFSFMIFSFFCIFNSICYSLQFFSRNAVTNNFLPWHLRNSFPSRSGILSRRAQSTSSRQTCILL